MRHISVEGVILVIAVSAYLFCTFGPYRPMIVMSRSMEPSIKRGDILIGEKVTKETCLDVGDVCTYIPMDAGYTVTHRIIAINGDTYVFKGDNNEKEDEEIVSRDRIKYHIIRKAGHLRRFIIFTTHMFLL